MPRQPANAGFTLLELLIAMALMALVLMGVSGAFQGVVTLYTTVQEQRTNAMQTRLLLGLLADDFRSLVPQGGLRTAEPGSFASADLGGSSYLRQHLVTFVSSVTVNQKTVEPSMGSYRVTYELRKNAVGDPWTLVRSEQAHPFIAGEWSVVPMKVVGNVIQCVLEFEKMDGFTTTTWSAPELQLEPGQPPPRERLPRNVLVKLSLRYGVDQQETYEFRIALPF